MEKDKKLHKEDERERKNECPLDYETLKMIVDNSYDEIYVTIPLHGFPVSGLKSEQNTKDS